MCGGTETKNENKSNRKILNLLQCLLNQKSSARLLGVGATNKLC